MYVLGIDFGGGACKATLLSRSGEIVGTHSVEYPTAYPRPGWAEQNPSDWFDATCRSIRAILCENNISAEAIAALTLDAATHTAVLCDDRFNVLRPAIYWTDSRSIAEVEFLRNKFGELIEEQVLHRSDTIWTLPQLLWIGKHEPEVWRNTKKILFAKDYVRNQLTGDYVTDYIEAQGSMFFDYRHSTWSEELCAVLEFAPDRLPKIVAPSEVGGIVSRKSAEKTGLREGTPVLCGTTDTALEVFASGAVRCGQMTVKLATAGRICVVTDRSFPNPFLINYSHIVPNLWYPGTATKSCAASYRWYRDAFGSDYRTLDEAAGAIEPGCDGLMFHPYLNGELTPYADPLLCGSFIGIRSCHTKAHFNRAVLEGVAFSLLDCRFALESVGIPHGNEAAIIGGGAVSPLWRRILADMLDWALIEKERSDSSFGGAMLAGTAIGFFKDLDDALKCCSREKSRTEPIRENTLRYHELFQKYKSVHDSLASVYHTNPLSAGRGPGCGVTVHRPSP